MRPYFRFSLILMMCICTISLSGCAWKRWFFPTSGPPQILSANPTLNEVIGVVNNNTSRVVSLTASSARLDGSADGNSIPGLKANIDILPRKKFRLRASHTFTGPEIDMGSNDEEFWIWMKRDPQKQMYVCRHDQFAGSQLTRVIPINPTHIIEAFGLVRFDANDNHSGPFRDSAGRLTIHSEMNTPQGPLKKISTIDPRSGWVVSQRILDGQENVLATIQNNEFRLDKSSGAYLPRQIDIHWPATRMSLSIDIGHLVVNQITPGQSNLWARPEFEGYRLVNLAGQIPQRPTEIREKVDRQSASRYRQQQ